MLKIEKFFQKKYTPIPYDNYLSKQDIKIIFTSGNALKNNGGTKLYNLWVKLLRENSYDAYIATVDGKYDRWLINHQPVVSIKTVLDFEKKGFKVKLVSSWLDSPFEKLGENNQFYYFDAELHWTIKFKEKLDKYIKQNKIAGIATHSRYIQSWYMANYGFKPLLINEWSDEKFFDPNYSEISKGSIGYTLDSEKDSGVIEYLKQRNQQENIIKKFVKIEGTEKEVSRKMKSVDVFVGLNKGKDEMWGEGCPRTQQEAMHSGAVLVAFDCLGNREYLIDKYTGLLVKRYDKEELWKSISTVLNDGKLKESLRKRGTQFAKSVFSDKGKFELVAKFLGLNGTSKEELSLIFDKPFWLQEDEVPFLSRYAGLADKTIVEIGCAYGGSSTVFLLNKKTQTEVYSIDPFVKDSMGGFKAGRRACYKAVSVALSKKNKNDVLKSWNLLNDYSYNIAQRWKERIDVLFIDGSHLYRDVKKDFGDWAKFVNKNGFILIHDSRKTLIDPKDKEFLAGWNGPTKLVREIIRSGKYKLVDSCYSISVLKKI